MEFLAANGAAILFWTFAILMVGSAILVVTLRNPMYSAMALLVTFLSVAVLFLLQNAEFVAGVQIFVYGGGLRVLVLVVIMLVNVTEVEQAQRFLDQLPWGLLLAAAAIACFGVIVLAVDFGTAAEMTPLVVDGEELGNTEAVGWILYRDFLLPFEVASVFLLVAMIGAVVLGRRD